MLSISVFFKLGCTGQFSPTEKDLRVYFLNSSKDGLYLDPF